MIQKSHIRFGLVAAAMTLLVGSVAAPAIAQEALAYGVTANGTLFSFNTATPAIATTIGNLGIVTEAIDFRPGTQTLYGIDVGPTTTQLYTIDTATAAITPVGAGFLSVDPTAANGGYSLVNASLGFDFNPRTLQADGSIRIRVVTSNGDNLRLNSDTGLIAAVDGDLSTGNGAPSVDGAAYINSRIATAGGATTLYDLDFRADVLYTQNPPNNGTLTLPGSLGAGVDANGGIGFDILSTGLDDTLVDDFGFAVLTRTAAVGGAYLLYDVNLTTGEVTAGALVGGGLDFSGGFAVIPEPSSLALLSMAAAACFVGARRRARRA